MTRIGLDSNILAYLAGMSRVPEDDAKIDRVRDLIGRLSKTVSLVAPAQTLGELFVVLHKGGGERGRRPRHPPRIHRNLRRPSEARTVIPSRDRPRRRS